MMENVPVKIAERYKPPPPIRQHSIQLNSARFQPNYYHESPEFSYDFKLERKVLATLPEWRKMRQLQKESRLERQEKRRLQCLRENEETQKKLLGDVKYPSTEELSSSSSYYEANNDEASSQIHYNASNTNASTKNADTNCDVKQSETETDEINSKKANDFHNILQPTILNSNLNDMQKPYTINKKDNKQQQYEERPEQAKPEETESIDNKNSIAVNLRRNVSFNYKDFEDDTSSPFDNIELKTINDLDILAQVLHNTQKPNLDELNEIRGNNEEETISSESSRSPLDNENVEDLEANIEANISEETQQMSVKEEYQMQTVNPYQLEKLIGNANDNSNAMPSESVNIPNFNNDNYFHRMDAKSLHFMDKKLDPDLAIPLLNNTNDYYAYNTNVIYNLQANQNQNYVISPNSNGYRTCEEAFSSPTSNHIYHHSQNQPHYDYHMTVTDPTDIYSSIANSMMPQRLEHLDCSKSKSVPDIIKELSQEVSNSVNRRIRNYSQNLDSKNNLLEELEPKTEAHNSYETITNEYQDPSNPIVKNICAMGFPRKRVNRVLELIGEDDKKIIEHLIVLTDLLDLGFDERKISDALLKYDNNKEKALEHLIT